MVYRVDAIIVVDRPELRGPSYPVVPAGTRSRWVQTTTSYNAALQMREEILIGHCDFAAEYVVKVRVDALRERTSPRTVRRLVERERPETRAQARLAVLRCEAVRRGRWINVWTATRPFVRHAGARCRDLDQSESKRAPWLAIFLAGCEELEAFEEG